MVRQMARDECCEKSVTSVIYLWQSCVMVHIDVSHAYNMYIYIHTHDDDAAHYHVPVRRMISGFARAISTRLVLIHSRIPRLEPS